MIHSLPSSILGTFLYLCQHKRSRCSSGMNFNPMENTLQQKSCRTDSCCCFFNLHDSPKHLRYYCSKFKTQHLTYSLKKPLNLCVVQYLGGIFLLVKISLSLIKRSAVWNVVLSSAPLVMDSTDSLTQDSSVDRGSHLAAACL